MVEFNGRSTPATRPTLASVVGALGTEAFERETLGFLHVTSGAEHFSVYRMRNGTAQFLGGASIHGQHAICSYSLTERRPDRSYCELRAADEAARNVGSALMIRDNIARTADPALFSALEHFGIVDRVMVCGRQADDFYALALLRSAAAGQFSEDELDGMSNCADVLVAACAKQASLHWDRARTAADFASVAAIERNLRGSDWGLSERERQVSARILHGISAGGIALDLGLREDTIATYRKRLYARLKISGRHELLRRYLTLL